MDGDEVLLSYPEGSWSMQSRFPASMLDNLIRDRREGSDLTLERAEEVMREDGRVRDEPAAEVAAIMRRAHEMLLKVQRSLMGSGY